MIRAGSARWGGPRRALLDEGGRESPSLNSYVAGLRTQWLGSVVDVRGMVGSTNDEATLWARRGASHGSVVVADAQHQGRGRRGQAWYSPMEENLYFSFVLRTAMAPPDVLPLGLAVGIGVCDAVREWGIAATLKWPNDVVVFTGTKPASYAKIAGILAEMSSHNEHVEYVVVGVGLNVNTLSFPTEIAHKTTSMRRELDGKSLPRSEVLATVLNTMEPWLDLFLHSGAAAIIPAYRERAMFLGKSMTIATDKHIVYSRAIDVDTSGALILRSVAGIQHRILTGTVVEIV